MVFRNTRTTWSSRMPSNWRSRFIISYLPTFVRNYSAFLSSGFEQVHGQHVTDIRKTWVVQKILVTAVNNIVAGSGYSGTCDSFSERRQFGLQNPWQCNRWFCVEGAWFGAAPSWECLNSQMFPGIMIWFHHAFEYVVAQDFFASQCTWWTDNKSICFGSSW